MSQPLPGLFAFAESRRLDVETEVRAMRVQAAVVRSLLDEMDEMVPSTSSEQLRRICAEQAFEELAHLASRMLAVAKSVPPGKPDP